MNAAYGCSMEDELDVIASHEETCPLRVVHCPAKHTSRSCTWMGSIPRMMEHNMETNCIQQLNNYFGTSSMFKGFVGDCRKVGMSVFDRSFITHYKPTLLVSPTWSEYLLYLMIKRSSHGLWYLLVRSIQPDFVVKQLRVELEVYKSEEEDQRHTYEGEVISSKLSDEEIMITGNFMLLTDSQIKRFISSETIFRYNITIWKLAPKRRLEEAEFLDERPIEDPPGQ